MLLTWLFLHQVGEELISEEKNRGKGPVLKVAQKATTTITQGRPGTRSEAAPAPNTHPAVVLCFSPTKDIVFLIAVIPGVTAAEQLALSCRDTGSSEPPPWGSHQYLQVRLCFLHEVKKPRLEVTPQFFFFSADLSLLPLPDVHHHRCGSEGAPQGPPG